MKKKDHMASLFAAAETLSTFKLAGSRRLHYPRFDLSCRSHDDSSFCGHRGEFVVIPEKPTLRKAFSVAAKTRTSSVALGGAEAESVSVIPAKAESSSADASAWIPAFAGMTIREGFDLHTAWFRLPKQPACPYNGGRFCE